MKHMLNPGGFSLCSVALSAPGPGGSTCFMVSGSGTFLALALRAAFMTESLSVDAELCLRNVLPRFNGGVFLSEAFSFSSLLQSKSNSETVQ